MLETFFPETCETVALTGFRRRMACRCPTRGPARSWGRDGRGSDPGWIDRVNSTGSVLRGRWMITRYIGLSGIESGKQDAGGAFPSGLCC